MLKNEQKRMGESVGWGRARNYLIMKVSEKGWFDCHKDALYGGHISPFCSFFGPFYPMIGKVGAGEVALVFSLLQK